MKDWDRVEEVRELTVEDAEAKQEAKDSFKKVGYLGGNPLEAKI